MIFDGHITAYSTCRTCKQLLHVTDQHDTTHPTCQHRPTRVERLAQEFLDTARADGDTSDLEHELHELASQPPRLGDAAVAYAKMGWPVFPLAPQSKVPAIPKAQGGQGVLDATTDVNQVARWWQRHPTHNIGLATGERFDVLDIDTGAGGVGSLLELLWSNVIPECHGVVCTASAGFHFYFPPTGSGNATTLHGLAGVDWRGRGGYVVAPPSRLSAIGSAWSWISRPSPVISLTI